MSDPAAGDRPREPHRAPSQSGPGLTLPDITDEYQPVLLAVEELLGHRFAEPRYLLLALIHPSVWETTHVSYERLEFLGDAVLGFVVSEELFQRYPDLDEGELTRIKSSVVSRTSLARVGRRLGIARFLVLGKGIQGAPPRSVIANATESLIGALYLDGGIEVAERFILEQISDRVRRNRKRRISTNPKSQLQQLSQKLGHGVPSYRVTRAEGPDHEKIFEIRAKVGERSFASARGSSKKIAEQRAARNALRDLLTELDE